MMSRLMLAAALLLAPTTAHAWGKIGHRVVGTIAEPYLTPQARRGVTAILGLETMAEASNWPDFMRMGPDDYWTTTSFPWHFVTVPDGRSYAQVGAPPEGDAVTGLARFAAVVRDRRAPLAARQSALRFIIHIVGDLHQPLHSGNGKDRGGNDVAVTFLGRPSNLHAVWDSGIVDQEQLSYSEMAAWLASRITPRKAKEWAVADPRRWIAESAALRSRIYPPAGTTELGGAYIFAHQREVEDRLTQGGVRLAAYLNALFAGTTRRRR